MSAFFGFCFFFFSIIFNKLAAILLINGKWFSVFYRKKNKLEWGYQIAWNLRKTNQKLEKNYKLKIKTKKTRYELFCEGGGGVTLAVGGGGCFVIVIICIENVKSRFWRRKSNWCEEKKTNQKLPKPFFYICALKPAICASNTPRPLPVIRVFHFLV